MTSNYTKAFNTANDVIFNYASHYLPVDIKEITAHFKNIRLSSYSQLMRKRSLSEDELKNLVGSDLGFIIRLGERHIIYYNDESKNPYLNRFTIAHELGHFFLGHLDGVSALRVLDEGTRLALEREANCFARNLLAPIGLVKRVLDDFTVCENNVNILGATFAISKNAAVTRLEMANADIIKENYDPMDWDNFDYADWRYCLRCHNVTLSAGYCEICGNDIRRKENYIHPGVPVDADVNVYAQLRTVICQRCGCEITPGEFGGVCKNCGERLENVCMNEKKSHNDPFYINDYAARYCHKCGSKTSFYAAGLLKEYYRDSAKLIPWVEFNKERSRFISEKSPK